MEPENRRGQGSITPTMLIGLGGAGSRIVDRIAERVRYLPDWESKLEPLTTFVSIDTNELDQHALRFIPNGNRINISAFDKQRVLEHYRRSNEQQALQWIDRGYRPRGGSKPGAGQIRVESRLGFFYHSPEIRAHLHRLVHDTLRPNITWRQSRPAKYNVYLFTTLAGGTGSGSFLSTAYLVDAVIKAQEWQPRVIGHLLLSTLMTTKVGPELHPDIHANTYAALKELEHLTKLGYPEVQRQGRTSEAFVYWRDENAREVPHVSAPPFFLSFIFDRPPHLGLPDTIAAVADASYLQIFTPLIENLAGELDNYEKNLENLTRFPGELGNLGGGYSKNFGAFGAVCLVLPGTDLLEYCALRFAAQALRRQITFGTDNSEASDDRSRTLARLAVNYSDPKFLNMSDEGRERAINQAFVDSLRAMARQDERDELLDGYWYQLVESVDSGKVTGEGPDGQPQRGETLLDQVERQLKQEREPLINKIEIRERSFAFPRESVNTYSDIIDRLRHDIRQARRMVDQGLPPLRTAAAEGEVVTDLKLDPIAERYLVLRLLERCESAWIPDAQQQVDTARDRDISSPKVRDRLETENFEMLKEAAARRGLFRRDQAFTEAQNEAFAFYSGVAKAARNLLEAEVRLAQLHHLLEFLRRRARQYARLATRMESLVRDLEAEAERLRRGERSLEPPFALRVEVFETLEEPRRRIWDRVYDDLFIDRGRYISTFDRQVLAATIAEELKPEVRADGSVMSKPLERTVNDLRDALLELGRQRLAPKIVGGDGNPGLDVIRGLDREARLLLADDLTGPDDVSEGAVHDYRERKFRALAQLAGVLARVDSADSRALDDGVIVNRTRQLLVGWRPADSASADSFTAQLKSVLSTSGRQVKEDTWDDPRIVVVHDVELPIPLYYVQPVVGEVEDAYLRLAADESLAYHLHTASYWEKSLPNLNPRRSEITVSWSLRILAEGLVTGFVVYRDGSWWWQLTNREDPRQLGESLSQALYSIGEIHRHEDLQRALDDQLATARKSLDGADAQEKVEKLAGEIEELIQQIGWREQDGAMTTADSLDRPILKALKRYLTRDWKPLTRTDSSPSYRSLGQ